MERGTVNSPETERERGPLLEDISYGRGACNYGTVIRVYVPLLARPLASGGQCMKISEHDRQQSSDYRTIPSRRHGRRPLVRY